MNTKLFETLETMFSMGQEQVTFLGQILDVLDEKARQDENEIVFQVRQYQKLQEMKKEYADKMQSKYEPTKANPV